MNEVSAGWVKSGGFPLNYEWGNLAALIRFLEGIDQQNVRVRLQRRDAADDPSLADRRDDLIQRQIRLLGNQRLEKVPASIAANAIAASTPVANLASFQR